LLGSPRLHDSGLDERGVMDVAVTIDREAAPLIEQMQR